MVLITSEYPHPVPSFRVPVPAPDVEPTDAPLVGVCFNYQWLPYILGALTQLTLQSTWGGFNDPPNDLAMRRGASVVELFAGAYNARQVDACDLVPTPFWDDEEDVEDSETADMQPWYGSVSNPEAPAGELDFVESVALWFFTGIVALATFEVGGLAPAIVFHTTVEKFIILQKRGDAAATIRFVIDGEDAKFVNTAPYAPGDIIETPIITPQTGGDHTLMIIQTA